MSRSQKIKNWRLEIDALEKELKHAKSELSKLMRNDTLEQAALRRMAQDILYPRL